MSTAAAAASEIPPLTDDEIAEQAAADAASAAALAGQGVATYDTPVPDGPRTAEQRHAAGGDPAAATLDGGPAAAAAAAAALGSGVAGDQPPVHRFQEAAPSGAPAVVHESPAPAPGPSAAAVAAGALPAPVAPAGIADVTAEELAAVRSLRATGRSAEILAQLAAAPRGVGADVGKYTIVHMSGCPDPDRLEHYEMTRSTDGRQFTVERCIECGAHLAIAH